MTRIPVMKSLLASAAVLSVAGALPAVASAHDHHRDRYERVETRPTVLIRETGHHSRQPVRARTVVVHDVRTRTVVRQPVVIRKTVIVRQPVRTVYVRQPVRTVYVRQPARPVYVREPVRTVYVRPQPVAVRYFTQPEVRTVVYSERLNWGGYSRSRSVNHFHHNYNRDSWSGGHRSGSGWGFGNWHW